MPEKNFASHHVEFDTAVKLICEIVEKELSKLGHAELSLNIFLSVFSKICNEAFLLIKSSHDGIAILPIQPPKTSRLSLHIYAAMIPALNEPITRQTRADRTESAIQIYQATLYRLIHTWTQEERLIGEKKDLRIYSKGIRDPQTFPRIKAK